MPSAELSFRLPGAILSTARNYHMDSPELCFARVAIIVCRRRGKILLSAALLFMPFACSKYLCDSVFVDFQVFVFPDRVFTFRADRSNKEELEGGGVERESARLLQVLREMQEREEGLLLRSIIYNVVCVVGVIRSRQFPSCNDVSSSSVAKDYQPNRYARALALSGQLPFSFFFNVCEDRRAASRKCRSHCQSR